MQGCLNAMVCLPRRSGHTTPASASPWVADSVRRSPLSGRSAIGSSKLPPLPRHQWTNFLSEDGDTSSAEALAQQHQGQTAFSVEELRNIILAPDRSKGSLEKPRYQARRPMTCSSLDISCTHRSAPSRDAASSKSKSAAAKHASVPDLAAHPDPTGTAAARREIARAFSSHIAAKHKSESPANCRRRVRKDDRDGASSCHTVDFDEDIVDYAEDKDLNWSGGVSTAMNSLFQPGKVRKRKGKTNGHDNPFVEYEDREQRLQWERRWLKDDEVYMGERMKGMRQSSVHARMQRKDMPRNVLYQDAVYFGAYSKELKQLLKKKADAGQDFGSTPELEANLSQAPKSRKGHADVSEGISSLKSMRAALKEFVSKETHRSSVDGASSPSLSVGFCADFKSIYKKRASTFDSN